MLSILWDVCRVRVRLRLQMELVSSQSVLMIIIIIVYTIIYHHKNHHANTMHRKFRTYRNFKWFCISRIWILLLQWNLPYFYVLRVMTYTIDRVCFITRVVSDEDGSNISFSILQKTWMFLSQRHIFLAGWCIIWL